MRGLMVGAVCGMVMLLAMAGDAAAQSGPALVIEPWPEGRAVQLRASGLTLRGHTEAADAGVRTSLYESRGRYRLDPADPHTPTVGYDLFHLTLRSDDAALPDRLTDASVGTAVLLHEQDDWTLTATVGAGFAGSRPFSDSRAWYGRAALLSFHQLDDDSSLLLALDYHGNRTLLPDVPLPGIAYVRDLGSAWQMTLGLPVSAVRWRPDDRWQIDVSYAIPTQFAARVGYEVVEGWELFGSFDSRQRGFHRHGDDRNRRLFFTQRRLEAGVGWQATDNAELTLAGGYAFGGKLERGYDVRDTDTVRRFSDEPYVRLAVDLAF